MTMNVTTADASGVVKRAAWNDDVKNKIKLSQHVSTCTVVFNINGKLSESFAIFVHNLKTMFDRGAKKMLEYMYEVQIISFAFQDFRPIF